LREQFQFQDSRDDAKAAHLQQLLNEAKRTHQETVMQNDAEHFKLRREIESLCEQARLQQKNILQRDQEVGSLQVELAKLKATLEALHETIHQRDNRIGELQRLLEEQQQRPLAMKDSSVDQQELYLLQHRAKAAEQEAGEQRSRAEASESLIDKLLGMLWKLQETRVQSEPPTQRPSSARSQKSGIWKVTSLQGLRQNLETQHGNLMGAFRHIDDNKSGHITMTEMISGLSEIGLSRREAETVFRRLQGLSHSQGTGSLTLSNWLAGFGADDGGPDDEGRSLHFQHFQSAAPSRRPSHGQLLKAVQTVSLPGEA